MGWGWEVRLDEDMLVWFFPVGLRHLDVGGLGLVLLVPQDHHFFVWDYSLC